MAELAPEDEAMRARCLDTIRRHAAQMSRLVEDLLSLTRLQSDSLSLARQDVQLADLARRVAGGMGPPVEAKQLNVAVTVDEALHVHADEHLLSQVFRNLLENACRYAPSGTTIEIDAVRGGGELITSVRDHGPGIPPYALTRVFERFYQVEPWRDSHSSGLGLAICKHIVERHGGRIWAANAQGAVISFALPLRDALARPADGFQA
jgi:two-component system phosphate regulon sensor histidine kinase PhoR